jgi:hypothetical protein
MAPVDQESRRGVGKREFLMGAILLTLCLATPAAAQQAFLSGARVSTALLSDSSTGRVSLHNQFDWTQPLALGSLTSSIDLARTATKTRNGRTAFEWRSTPGGPAFAKAGAFSLAPMQFQNRSGNVALPSISLRGFQTGFAIGRTTVGLVTGNILQEDGPGGWATRKTEDRISGIRLSRTFTRDAGFAIEADRVTSGGASKTLLRPSFRWMLAKGTAVNGEYAAQQGGKPSFHFGIERENATAAFHAAYVRRSRQYLSLAPLISFADREGVSLETRLRVAGWLELNLGGSNLHTNVDRRTEHLAQRTRQYSASANFKLAATTQMILNHQSLGISQRGWSWRQVQDSATLVHTTGRLSTRLRADRSVVNFSSQTLGVELEGGRDFLRTALSGRVRWQRTQNDANRTGGMSTSIRGSRNVGKRLSLAVQAEFSGQRQSASLSRSQQRTLTGSAGMSLSKTTKLSANFFGAENSWRPSPSLAQMVTATHTVYLAFEKTFH